MTLQLRLQKHLLDCIGRASVPVSINRGYWHTGRDVARWMVTLADGSEAESMIPMKNAIKVPLVVQVQLCGTQIITARPAPAGTTESEEKR